MFDDGHDVVVVLPLQVRAADHVPVILVGNKVDLESEGHRTVSPEEGQDLARKFGCRFLETSAAHRRRVDDVFHALVRDIRSRQVRRNRAFI